MTVAQRLIGKYLITPDQAKRESGHGVTALPVVIEVVMQLSNTAAFVVNGHYFLSYEDAYKIATHRDRSRFTQERE